MLKKILHMWPLDFRLWGVFFVVDVLHLKVSPALEAFQLWDPVRLSQHVIKVKIASYAPLEKTLFPEDWNIAGRMLDKDIYVKDPTPTPQKNVTFVHFVFICWLCIYLVDVHECILLIYYFYSSLMIFFFIFQFVDDMFCYSIKYYLIHVLLH